MGGPSGGCIPAELQDTIIDYESINKTGAIMGSGGLVVMDETTCMVDVARFFLDFTQRESCGKCTFCRVGTKRMLEILTRITEGKGKEGDIELLEQLAGLVKNNSLCGLGQTAPNPVLTTLKYFRSEYEAHISNKKCPAHALPAAPDLHDHRGVQRLHGVRAGLPVGRHHGREEADARDRPLEVHPVRRVLQDLQVPRHRQGLGPRGRGERRTENGPGQARDRRQAGSSRTTGRPSSRWRGRTGSIRFRPSATTSSSSRSPPASCAW